MYKFIDDSDKYEKNETIDTTVTINTAVEIANSFRRREELEKQNALQERTPQEKSLQEKPAHRHNISADIMDMEDDNQPNTSNGAGSQPPYILERNDNNQPNASNGAGSQPPQPAPSINEQRDNMLFEDDMPIEDGIFQRNEYNPPNASSGAGSQPSQPAPSIDDIATELEDMISEKYGIEEDFTQSMQRFIEEKEVSSEEIDNILSKGFTKSFLKEVSDFLKEDMGIELPLKKDKGLER